MVSRATREMRSKVTLVARNLERAEKIRLQREIKDAIGSVGVAEVGALYKDDAALADMAQHPTRSTRSIASERPMPGCSSVASSRSSPAWSCSFSGPGPDAALPSALSPSRSGSQRTAVSL